MGVALPDILKDLHQTCASLGCILFTVSRLDPPKGVVWRCYTSHPVEYPLQGTKPLERDAWYDSCITGKQTFVANTPAEFEKVFFDHALITSMGLGSAANIPVADDSGQVIATVNLLAESGHFTVERLHAYESLVTAARPALVAALV